MTTYVKVNHKFAQLVRERQGWLGLVVQADKL